MKIKDIMTLELAIASERCNVYECAQKMSSQDVGIIPVCREGKVLGVVTDRDLVLRCLAEKLDPEATLVTEVMTQPSVFCKENDEIESAIRLMEVKQVRRLMVVNYRQRLVGIVSLTDLAVRADQWQLTEEALQKISQAA